MDSFVVGQNGVNFTKLVLGTVTFGREIDQDQAFRIMDYAVEHGVKTFDTAEQYGSAQSRLRRKRLTGLDNIREVSNEMHSSEVIIGRWLKATGMRKNITLCTKVSTGGNANNIHSELSRSLDRLETNYVDVYYMHTPNRDGTALSETLGALNQEIDNGHIREIGCSNYSLSLIREALEISEQMKYRRFEVVQNPYSLISRDIEDSLLTGCVDENLNIVTYSPLAAGLLAGFISPDRLYPLKGSRFYVAPDYMDLYYNERNFEIVEFLRYEAQRLGITMARLAMAWVLHNKMVHGVIIGADDIYQFSEAVEAMATIIEPAVFHEMSKW